MESKFIVIDGLDAAGKSVMAKKLKFFIEGRGEKVFLTAEPSGSVFGKELRELLKKETDPKKFAEIFLTLYVKDREQHLEKEILPALKAGKIVLCDRYKYSTIAYQAAQGISVKQILKLHEKMLVPSLVLILDVNPKIALKRIERSARKNFDVFEQEKFLEQVREIFLELPKIFPKENIKIINSNKLKQRVFSELKSEVSKFLLCPL